MTGPGMGCALLAVAVLVYPARVTAGRRVRALFGEEPAEPVTRMSPARALPIALAVSVGALSAAWAGLPQGVLGLPLAGGCWWGAARWLGTASRGAARPGSHAAAPDQLRLAASWDLLAACLRAGLPVPTAIRAVAGDVPGGAADGLRASAELITLGADPERAWAPAMEHPATAPLARSARRTARSGTALAEVAAALADKVRAETSDAAEAKAQRAGVLITGPLGLCFLPAFLCLGVLPVIVGLANQLAIPL